MFRKSTLLLCSVLTSALLLASCGKNEELTAFEENMSSFYTNITAIGDSINAIDVNSADAVDTMMSHLQEMSTEFEKLAEMSVPADFVSVEDLADDAYEYMQEALRLYEEAYQEDSVNDSFIQAASQNYESAMKRVNYIATLLQGEIPEGATVIEGDGNEFEPYTE